MVIAVRPASSPLADDNLDGKLSTGVFNVITVTRRKDPGMGRFLKF
jgi:hypothetical protein